MKKLLLVVVMAGLAMTSFGQNVVWKKNFGGSFRDYYQSVTAVSDGIVAVGASNGWSFGGGDWEGVQVNGNNAYYDAIIVKYDNYGNVAWKKNFGGSSSDTFQGVTKVSDGIIAVGYSWAFGDGDWTGVTGNGNGDAIIVKFDNNGNVVWKKNFGGSGDDRYFSVTTVSDGIIAVGTSEYGSFGTGDWVGVTGKKDNDAIIVKYDFNGNVLWKNNYGTPALDIFYSVTAVSDGVIAVGYMSYRMYMGTIQPDDAIIVKFDNAGNLVWDKTLEGSALDDYYGITTVSDGVIAVGYSDSGSFDNGVWAGIAGKGSYDAIAVKYDNDGNVLWKKNFGGSRNDDFECITTMSDGFIVAGFSYVNNTGDWTGITGKGSPDAILVKYDFNGNVQWKNTFGGAGDNEYHSLAVVSDGIVAVGEANSFGAYDLVDVTGNGDADAIIVKYGFSNTDIPELQQQAGITVSPSPATDFVTVSGLQG
ncbi:MAG: hypothetical protein FWD60_12705, partial [Candidatus Azobacteroides sp.]|nr:hypothetical protein [Candidatus Azobacteroides sp.]